MKNQKNTEIETESTELLRAMLRTKEHSEVLYELNLRIEEVREDDFDAELVKVYQAVLEEKAPLENMSKFDAEQSFREFQEKYAILYDAAVFGAFDFSYAPIPKRIYLKTLAKISPSCVLSIEGKNIVRWCKEKYKQK